MIITGKDKQKLTSILEDLYEEASAIAEEALFRRVTFLTKELEIIKAYENKVLDEIFALADDVNKLKEKDVQSKEKVVE